MLQNHTLIKGTAILTIAGMLSRVIGFFYRIFLSQTIGAEGVGIYQLIFPVYTLMHSLTASGIQTAISRFVSSKTALKDYRGARDMLFAGLVLSILFALICSLILWPNAELVAASLLFEPRCAPLLQILCLAVPFSCIHSCIIGYYMGLKRTDIPAVSQLFEQLIRVASSFLIYRIFLERNLAPTPILAVLGMLCSETAAVLYTVTAFLLHHPKQRSIFSVSFPFHCIPQILSFSLPLTANRLLLTLLQSVEAVCIPLRLQTYGLDNAAALTTYGTLTGMSLPLVLFPSAITNSLSAMLLPAVSEAQAAKNEEAIANLTQKTVKSCLLLGTIATVFFLFTGNLCGTYLFQNQEAGTYILILAWLCPFLYLGSTLGSILNGLGQTFFVFLVNLLSLLIRIAFVWFAIPLFGVRGYLWGLLAAQLLQSILLLCRCLFMMPGSKA